MAATVVRVGTLASNEGKVCGDKNSSSSSSALDLASIAPMINAGFRAVLKEASNRGVLDPPHGRTPMPDPTRITEESPFNAEDGGDSNGDDREDAETKVSDRPRDDDDDDDDDDEKLLEYKFDYGFNPLVFLGEFLRRNNPEAVRARMKQHKTDLEYLRRRAAKSLAREAALVELRELAVQRQSGITHGPIVGDLSDCRIVVWARTFRSGQFTIELSLHEDFRTICRKEVMKVDHRTECTAIVEIDDLDPSTTWYHRTFLHNPRRGFDGPAAGFCVKGKFSTLPERDEDRGRAFRLVSFSLHGLGLRSAATEHRPVLEAACSAISAGNPGCCLVLGAPSRLQGLSATHSVRRFAPESFSELHDNAARIPALSRLLQENGFLTACGLIPKLTSKRQRTTGKHHHRSAKNSTYAEGAPPAGSPRKTTKPQRGSGRVGEESPNSGGDDENSPPLTDWPIRCPEAWGSRPLCPTAELFILDARAGFLGEDQLAWAAEAVEESTRKWKVIACGVPVGFPTGPVAEVDDEDAARLNAAAMTIQASVRSRFQSKAPAVSTSAATHTTAATKKSALAPGGGGVQRQGRSSRPTSPSNERSRPSPATVGATAAGASATPAFDGGVAGKSGGHGSGDEINVFRATVQVQGLVSQLHASGCSNVVLVTPARSQPHALSFFPGHEAEGRYPIYELGCIGLVPPVRGSSSGERAPSTAVPGPNLELEPQLLMADLAASLSARGNSGENIDNNGDDGMDRDGGGGGRGVACTLCFGREEGNGDGLTFVVSGERGEEIASLVLPAAAS